MKTIIPDLFFSNLRHYYLMPVICFVCLMASLIHAGQEIKLIEKDGVVYVTLDGKTFTDYHYKDADRPYFYPLIGTTGENITRHWPMNTNNKSEQRDHRHHRSLWFTHGSVNGYDFWTEGRGSKTVQTKLKLECDGDKGIIITENEWRTKDGQIVCTDRRKHTITTEGTSRIIDFEVTIKADHGKVILGDTKEGSMAVRLAPTLRVKGKVARGSIRNSEGVKDRQAWGKRADWCDCFGPLNGKTVGITIMDHPQNPRHPTWWHARDYGLCAANPFGISYFEKKPKGTGDMEIKNGESVTFKYRIFIHNGSTEEAAIEQHYQAYIKGSE